MERKTRILVSVVCFLTGVIVGFFIAPIKQGFGNNCGNTNHYNEKSCE